MAGFICLPYSKIRFFCYWAIEPQNNRAQFTNQLPGLWAVAKPLHPPLIIVNTLRTYFQID